MGDDPVAAAPSVVPAPPAPAPLPFVASDEGPHDAGRAPWAELWWFAGVDGDTGAAVVTAYGVVPAERRAWYSAALVRPEHPVLFVADDEIGRAGTTMTVRRTNLWADHTCEAPFDQWTVANEAHAVALDHPLDALGDGRGTPVAMAFDLEWYAAAPPRALLGGPAVTGYAQAGEIDGVVELAGGAVRVVGASWRVHAWGDLTALHAASDEPSADADADADAGADADAPGVVARWPLPGGGTVAEQWLRRGAWRLALRRGAS